MTTEELLEVEVLLPYQQAWGRDNSEVKVWEKSRRIGASYAEAALSVLEAAKPKNAGGQSTHYLSYNKDMTRQFIDDCATWAKALNKAAGEMEEIVLDDEDKDITVFRISFAAGNEIWGLPSTPRVLRSKQGRVVLDEAAFVDDLEALIEAAMALTIWGGSVSILSTHNGDESEFNTLITDIKEGRQDYSLHRTTIQDALDDGLYKRICFVKRREWSEAAEGQFLESLMKMYRNGPAQELYCIPAQGGTRYISRSLVESCMDKAVPVLAYECSDEFTFKSERHRTRRTETWIASDLESILRTAPSTPAYIGMDFARSGDLSAIAIAAEEGERLLRSITYLELRNVPFAQQLQILYYCIENLPRFFAAAIDARGNGQMIAEYAAQKYGPESVHQVMPSRPFYMEYMPKYKARFEDNEIIIPHSTGIIDDHRTVILDRGVPLVSERTGTAREKRHGDTVIAGVLLIYARENDEGGHGGYAYEPVPGSSPWKGASDDEDW